ncbi:MAG: hypothetical protein A2600_11395 [Candidatus Lambdaproteobacteria bacterium RIFOXYD1_FULL_56_27]|uniref:tRNA (cytidine(34)-2'-O)-methyltransferase n=1 Tax=Candidatus Lambdaproteobacteria bacterium RIFOXYD2_FULL_56_26 TaxID=1817773 RepID=A0A1F6H0Q5_9PROT|nr:MAG: hypothetical protein A2426_12605 [Candidatus Lambdaproteobacteria bacterium RIFOXYC1_FULL_56_13]OGH03975.1 MAG: hypothetical protein A2557_11155 [Candidatus Lambdaproteobacteria bacterium RIFOXYD2_FULL_56_26]OGH08366.1 MAG: hypothetical protein A2600_11395 [Candidatus Lambdaproteobacteria bacterium RIFOXYD1_FULL_56_27]
MFTLTLIEPEIPPNTGNIARLCAATGTRLEVVGPIGFSMDDKAVKRAGLDYWDQVDLLRILDKASFLDGLNPEQCHFFSTKALTPYHQAKYQPGDRLIFGAETRGLGPEILARFAHKTVLVPIFNPKVRSLNLSNTAALALYEALRQTGALDQPCW